MVRATAGHTYLWELAGWPRFTWNGELLAGPLDVARRAQSELLGVVKAIGGLAASEAAVDAMTREVVSNSAIEGVHLDLESVRASMMLRLGIEANLGQAAGNPRRVDPVVEVLAEAAEGWRAPLTMKRLFGWHRALFPKGVPDGFQTLPAGELRGAYPMVVATLSRHPGEPETIHFEAPAREVLERELEAFLRWFNTAPEGLNGLLRAGIAHLWFITIHPMADGNGRLARTLTDLALSQDERLPRRFYSLSVQFMRNKSAYYDSLEQAQLGSLDLSNWLIWFLSQVTAATRHGTQEVGRVLARGHFWAEVKRHRPNERQERMLRSVLSSMGTDLAVSNRRYRAITGTSRATAARDLAELAGMGLVVPFGEARSASYLVDLERFLPEGFWVEAD
jgi:Fic family protein